MNRPLNYLRHAWNIIAGHEHKFEQPNGMGTYYNPYRTKLSLTNERTTMSSVCNRIALDAASVKMRHCKLDENGRFSSELNTSLNHCLKFEANKDQTARAFITDIILSMLDEGCVAVVPTDVTLNPDKTDSYDILSMRTGKIIEWFPDHVRVRLYDDRDGQSKDILVEKRYTAIIENPLYSVMNEPNSTMKRLTHKLSLMDQIDEGTGSGNLDLIIQLPYMVSSAAKRKQAEERRKQLEEQLNGARYGVGYIDGTEKVTQLNRSVENNLMKQIEYLTSLLYSQLGITQSIMDGTADENTLNNYYTRTIEPILSAIVDEFTRKFLTKTAISQNKIIMYFRDPFKLMSVNNIAEIADKFTRNEILSSNEIRQIVGIKPSDDPAADELRNKNLSQSKEAMQNSINQNEEDTVDAEQ